MPKIRGTGSTVRRYVNGNGIKLPGTIYKNLLLITFHSGMNFLSSTVKNNNSCKFECVLLLMYSMHACDKSLHPFGLIYFPFC